MCGFSGERRSDGRWADVRTVAAMADTMQRRGPDGSGVYAMGQVALAHQRLKVIDLSDKAAQPMVDPELGLSTVFNGCIYNYSELRAQLTQAGYTFFSSGDTEVVLKAYDHWGDDFVSRLQGMFAFCIVERDSSRMLLGRDRLGIKPLYIAETSGALRFASTLPALVAGRVEAKRSAPDVSAMYNGLMPNRSRPSSIRELSRSTMQKANMPCKRDTKSSPQWS